MRRDLFLEEILCGTILVSGYQVLDLREARLYENLCKADSAFPLVPLV